MSNADYKRILVTGATGFLAHHLLPVLRREFPESEILPVSRADADLLEPCRRRPRRCRPSTPN